MWYIWTDRWTKIKTSGHRLARPKKPYCKGVKTVRKDLTICFKVKILHPMIVSFERHFDEILKILLFVENSFGSIAKLNYYQILKNRCDCHFDSTQRLRQDFVKARTKELLNTRWWNQKTFQPLLCLLTRSCSNWDFLEMEMKRKELVLARNNKRRKVWRKTLSKNDAWFWKLLTRSGKSSFCNSSCGSAETSVREACGCLFIMWEVWRTFYMFHICLWFLGFAFPHQHVEPERENNENPNVFISTLGQGERGRVGERFPSVKLHDDGALDMKFLKGTCLPNFRCCGWELSFQSLRPPASWHEKPQKIISK